MSKSTSTVKDTASTMAPDLASVVIPTDAKHRKKSSGRSMKLHTHLERNLMRGKPTAEPVEPKSQIPKAVDSIGGVIREIKEEDVSSLYTRDLLQVGESFLSFLKTEGLNNLLISRVLPKHIKSFLKTYKKSSAYYMNRRQTLSGLFSRIVDSEVIDSNPVHQTTRLKLCATLHKPYTKEQLTKILEVLEQDHPNLHLCAMLMYGCLLRPHQEIRFLTRNNLSNDMRSISLAGSDNKSKRVRTVFVPEYVMNVLIKQKIHELSSDANIFSRTCDVYNQYYFSTAWSRSKEKFLTDGAGK